MYGEGLVKQVRECYAQNHSLLMEEGELEAAKVNTERMKTSMGIQRMEGCMGDQFAWGALDVETPEADYRIYGLSSGIASSLPGFGLEGYMRSLACGRATDLVLVAPEKNGDGDVYYKIGPEGVEKLTEGEPATSFASYIETEV